jgi:hypothetical protein
MLEIDYQAQPVEQGDIFLLATDGVYEHVERARHGGHHPRRAIGEALSAFDGPPAPSSTPPCARAAATTSPRRSCASMRCRAAEAGEMARQLAGLPLPPILDARTVFEGYTIVREVHGSSRSHIYLATDSGTGERVILKTPSIDLGGDPAYLERFLTEEWIARRINSAHVLKPTCRPASATSCTSPPNTSRGRPWPSG